MRKFAVVLVLAGFVAAAHVPLGATVARAQNAPPPCGVRTRSPPLLTRYDALTRGARFIVRLRYDEATRSWTPSPSLAMPLHHASTIEYVGYAMPTSHDFELELEVGALGRRLVRYDEPIHTWFFAYRVRVRAACSTRPPR